MAMRAGSYNAAVPCWRGTIRDGSYPEYVCVHTDHESQSEATTCARQALIAIRATPDPLPEGWITYTPKPAT
jgi:hypothetical protein